jgi:N-acetylmuramoyl-L-alanine amidase
VSKLIVIDPGHGGWDPGSMAVDGQAEAVSNWQGAVALRDALAAYDVDVIMTHEGADTFLAQPGPGRDARELSARCAIANTRGAALLISLHHDSGVPAARGGSFFVWSKHNSLTSGLMWEPANDGRPDQNHSDPKSYPIAADLVGPIRDVMTKFGIPWRGYGDPLGIAASNMGILRNTQGPAVLLEAYFGTNAADVAAARRPEFYPALAKAIATAMATALQLPKKAPAWSAPAVKVILPGGQELWGTMRRGVTYVTLPGTDFEQAIRPVADAMGRTVKWTAVPPTVTFE